MVGFLTHLVQRTLAPSNAMAPRLAGPYEGLRRDQAGANKTADEPIAGHHAAPTAARTGSAMTSPRGDIFIHPEDAAPLPLAGQALLKNSDDHSAHAAHDARPIALHDIGSSAVPRMQAWSTPLRPVEVGMSVAPMPQAEELKPEPELHLEERLRSDVPQMLPSMVGEGRATASRIAVRAAVPAAPPISPLMVDDGRFTAAPIAALAVPDLTPQHQAPSMAVVVATPGAVRWIDTLAPVDTNSPPSTVPSVDPSTTSQRHLSTCGALIEPPSVQATTTHGDAGDARSAALMHTTPAPTVHVTIGRIELRAAAQAATRAPSRPAEARPTLSLVDYLEKRNTGGAR